jgi:hypothetical protein
MRLARGALALALVACAAPSPRLMHPDMDAKRIARKDPPRAHPDVSVEPSACGRCHTRELQAWRRSGHARAFTEPLFEREWSLRRSPWCLTCHAPRSELGHASLGVDCASCHLRDGAVIAARASGRAPHASHADPTFAGPDACARCHEFRHPRRGDLLVQSTLSEHAASPSRDVPCQRCHMPNGSHAFPGVHDRALLSEALDVRADAVRESADTVRVTLRLRASGAGHAVPTGDLGRLLVVTAELGATRAQIELGRTIRIEHGRYVEVADTRVPPDGEREVTLVLHGRGADVRWRVDLFRMPFTPGERTEPLDLALRHPMVAGRAPVRDAR